MLLSTILIVWLFQPVIQFVHTTTLGPFVNAFSCIANPSFGVIVFDPAAQSVVRWADLDRPPTRIGGFGWSAGSFDQPRAGLFDGLTLYVADYGNHRIQRFDSGLRYLSSLSTHDTSDISVQFGYPLDVAITTQGSLLVLDGENSRVVSFDREGRFEKAFGNRGTEQQRIQHPSRLRFWSSDTLLVVEPHRCVVYDVFGNFIREIPAPNGVSLQSAARDGQELLLAARDSIYWCSFGGTVRARMALSSIIADEPVRDLSDVVVESEKIFLLTSMHLFVFRILRN